MQNRFVSIEFLTISHSFNECFIYMDNLSKCGGIVIKSKRILIIFFIAIKQCICCGASENSSVVINNKSLYCFEVLVAATIIFPQQTLTSVKTMIIDPRDSVSINFLDDQPSYYSHSDVRIALQKIRIRRDLCCCCCRLWTKQIEKDTNTLPGLSNAHFIMIDDTCKKNLIIKVS